MKAKQTNKIGHIEVDDVYVTVLTGRLETNEEGWQKVVPTDRSQRMTGSMIINAVVKILMETSIRRTEQMAALLEVDALELTHAVHLLTGLSLQEFILGYRNRPNTYNAHRFHSTRLHPAAAFNQPIRL